MAGHFLWVSGGRWVGWRYILGKWKWMNIFYGWMGWMWVVGSIFWVGGRCGYGWRYFWVGRCGLTINMGR